MILGIEIALTLYGLYALIKGRWSIGKGKVVFDSGARLLGGLAMLTVPLVFIVGIVWGVFVAITNGTVSDAEVTGVILELIVVVIWAIFIVVLSNWMYKKQEAKQAASDYQFTEM